MVDTKGIRSKPAVVVLVVVRRVHHVLLVENDTLNFLARVFRNTQEEQAVCLDTKSSGFFETGESNTEIRTSNGIQRSSKGFVTVYCKCKLSSTFPDQTTVTQNRCSQVPCRWRRCGHELCCSTRMTVSSKVCVCLILV